jgi:hypothetical protein
MAVTQAYLNKLRRAVRRKADIDIDAELTDIIDECRLDLASVGILQADDETDSLILGAVRCYVRWKFGLNSVDADRNMEAYKTLKDDLMKKHLYNSYAVTFTVTQSGSAAIHETVYFNGQTELTSTLGKAVFYVKPGNGLQYYVLTKEGEIDVTADTSVSVVA